MLSVRFSTDSTLMTGTTEAGNALVWDISRLTQSTDSLISYACKKFLTTAQTRFGDKEALANPALRQFSRAQQYDSLCSR